MTIREFDASSPAFSLEQVARSAFADGEDSSIEKWFSFSEMVKSIEEGRGVCLEALSDDGDLLGFVYAHQESPVNGEEGREKWVIIMTAVVPESSGKGVGSELLTSIESTAKQRGASKMFVYTNKGDEEVISFYHKNGYADAGEIKDYQYGKDNSAVFLLKYL